MGKVAPGFGPARYAGPLEAWRGHVVGLDTVPMAAFLALLATRVGVSGAVLNTVMSYSTEGGMIFEKLHPASLGLIGLGAIGFPEFLQSGPTRPVRGVVALIAAVVFSMLVAVITGNTLSLGYLIDSVLVAPFCVVTLSRMNADQVRTTFQVLFLVLVANALLTLAEYVLQARALPFDESEDIFRPTGLMSHPLLVGLTMATAVPSAFYGPLRSRGAWIVAFLFEIAALAAGARAAGIVGAAVLGAAALSRALGAMNERRLSVPGFVTVVLLMVLGIASLGLVAVEYGLTSRIEGGFDDESSRARVDVYDILFHLTPNELLFGSSLAEAMEFLRGELKLEYIESPLVFFVIQFGVVGTVPIVSGILYFISTLSNGMGGIITALAFVIVASTNNTFSTKGPALVLVTALLWCCRESGAPKRAPFG